MRFKCDLDGCQRVFGDQRGLTKHMNVTHAAYLQRRRFQDVSSDSIDLDEIETAVSELIGLSNTNNSLELPSETTGSEGSVADFDHSISGEPDSGINIETHGQPTSDEVYDCNVNLERTVREKFTPADLDCIIHVIHDNPMGQNAITKKLQFDRPRLKEIYVPTFKSGKQLHAAVDSFSGLSVDYELKIIPINVILESLPRKYHGEAQELYNDDPVHIYLRPLDKLLKE
ncbi:hypothetical protein HDU99_003772, partial [Rhizoclosmatium hyalinum]